MRPTVASETAKPSARSNGPILARPHTGKSRRNRSTAWRKAGVHVFGRTRCGRRLFGAASFSQRYSVELGTPTAWAAGSAPRPLARAGDHRITAVSDNMAGQAKHLHEGSPGVADSQLSASETPRRHSSLRLKSV